MFGTKGLEAKCRLYFVVGEKIYGSPKFAKSTKSEEGNTEITHWLLVRLLSQPSELVSDDDCRVAVSILNQFRTTRVEDLVDGYDVSCTLCYDQGYDIKPLSLNPVS
jgi:hypothetical protein